MTMGNNRLMECNRDWTGITVVGNKGKPVFLTITKLRK